jgi:hypothetical protein
MYKPRIVEFETDRINAVDTRMGKQGLYPGDEIMVKFSGELRHCMIVGVVQLECKVLAMCELKKNKVDMWPWFVFDKRDYWVFESKPVITKRHGKHLIKEMKMI